MNAPNRVFLRTCAASIWIFTSFFAKTSAINEHNGIDARVQFEPHATRENGRRKKSRRRRKVKRSRTKKRRWVRSNLIASHGRAHVCTHTRTFTHTRTPRDVHQFVICGNGINIDAINQSTAPHDGQPEVLQISFHSVFKYPSPFGSYLFDASVNNGFFKTSQ